MESNLTDINQISRQPCDTAVPWKSVEKCKRRDRAIEGQLRKLSSVRTGRNAGYEMNNVCVCAHSATSIASPLPLLNTLLFTNYLSLVLTCACSSARPHAHTLSCALAKSFSEVCRIRRTCWAHRTRELGGSEVRKRWSGGPRTDTCSSCSAINLH